MKTQSIPEQYIHVSPAGAEIRMLMHNSQADLVHCKLRDGKISRAVAHKTVSEYWHVLSGHGAIWRRQGEQQSITPLTAGITVDIRLGTEFQYRADPGVDLVFLCFTMPTWSGANEAHYVNQGAWIPTSE